MKKYGKKALLLIFCIAFSFAVFSPRAHCEDGSTLAQMPDGYSELSEVLPEDVKSSLPDGMLSSDAEAQGRALEEVLTPEYIFSFLGELLGVSLSSSVTLFVTVCGLLVISSALTALRGTVRSESLAAAARFCSTGAVFAALIYSQSEQLSEVAKYFERLDSLMKAMIPIGAAVLAMGGNIATASAASGTLPIFLTVAESLCAATVIPVSCACTALALGNSISPDMGLRGFSNAIRKTYTFILGTVMTLLLAILSSQTLLASASDSTGARAARLVSTTAIPVVGGTVSQTLGTVSAGVGYLKSVVGVGGIVFIAALLLPVLVSLILSRLVFLLTGGVADMLGCETEARLLSELGSIWGTLIAVVAMCAVMFILALVVLVKITVAA